MDKIYCQNCGQSVLPNMKICPQCGGTTFGAEPLFSAGENSTPDIVEQDMPDATFGASPSPNPNPNPNPSPSGSTGNMNSSASMSFPDAIKICMAKFIDFDGRATRPEFWYWQLCMAIGGFTTAFIDGMMTGDTGVLYICFTLIMFLPNMAVTVRRLHDTGRTGWWFLLQITIIGIPILIYFACQRSDKHQNTYGYPD